MKKSELKEIIREVVKEELEKLEATKAADEVATEEPAAEAEESTEDTEVVESLTESVEGVQEEACDGEACLEEGADIIPTDSSMDVVREGSIESLAVDIYNSDEFIDAFVEDGQTFGYAVDEVISDAVMAAYPSFDGDRLEDIITRTRKAIRAHADREDQDFQLSYSHDFTGDIDRIRKDHFDLAGNAY